MVDLVNKIVVSKKFYLPLMLIAIGILSYAIISYTIKKVSKINNKVTNKLGHQHSDGYNKRKITVVNLINSVIKYIIAIIIIINILEIYGVNTDKIIASLGVASVVIGLAFQDIIKDFLAGIFIVFDNAYAVGDWVTIDNFKGEVIAMGLKTTKIKAYTGEVMIISNSNLTKVINYNLNHPKLFIQVPFGYDEKIEKIEEILTNILKELETLKEVTSTKLLGVESFEESFINYSIEVECLPNTQHVTRRLLLKKIKMAFDKNKITIPYNQLDVHIEK